MGKVRTPGKPSWCNGSTLAWNARDLGSSPTLGTVFPIFIKPMTLVAVTMILYKLQALWLLNLPCVVVEPTLYMYGHCLYVSNCKHYNTYNPKGTSVVCTDL